MLCLAAILYGCGRTGVSYEKKPVTATVAGKVMEVQDYVGSTLKFIEGDTLVCSTFSDQGMMAAYKISADTLTYLFDFLNKGRGPNEFFSPVMKRSGISGYDIMNTSETCAPVCLYSISGAMENVREYSRWETYDLQWTGRLFSGDDFVRLSDDTILLLGAPFGSKSLLTVLDLDTRTVETVPYWIEDGKDVPDFPKQSVYTVNSNIFLNNDRLLYSAGEGRYLELTDISPDGHIGDRKLIYGIYPNYSSKDGMNYRIEKPCYRGMDVYATERYIYVRLNSAETGFDDYKGYPWYYYDEVEVYDWEGNFKECIQTDIPFGSMAVTGDDRTLYVQTMDMATAEPMIVRYDIEKVL